MVQRATVLADFQRTIRNEPLYLVYKTQIWVEKDQVSADEVIAWLRDRYVQKSHGHRYRVVTYLDKTNDVKYVDYILMETCDDNDLVYMKLRWGWSDKKVKRGNRVPRRRLKKDQKALLDAIIKKTREDFLNSLG